MKLTQKTHAITIIGLIILLALAITACTSPGATPEPEAEAESEIQSPYAGKKIVWVDSYHAEYEWSAEIEQGLRDVLDETGVELKIIRMDTKRNDGDAYAQAAALTAKAEIEAFQPDLVIASDDGAQKHLVVPYLKDTDLPVIYCAVNWDASEYGFPASNVTGMIEVDLVVQMVELLKPYAQGERLAYLSGDTTTDRKVVPIYNERFFNGEMTGVFVQTFDEFKEEYVRLQDETDILYFGNNAGIEGWDDEAAEAFILENTKIPTGSRSTWMGPFVLITLAKLGQEQGEWAAQTALNILDGAPIATIPEAENKQGQLILNLHIAEQLDAVFTPSMLRNAEIYGLEEASK
jgi:ABC-type uncharacterized transport system substrate-binding protein